MSKWVVDIHGDIEGDYEIIKEYEEPKTGHWILDETDNSITCNKCGCLMWASDLCHGDAHYCPNCGARMESEVRNEQK